MGTSATHRERVMKELVQGQRFANQLHLLLRNPNYGDHHPHHNATELLVKILRSFSQTLSFLTSSESFSGEVSLNISSSPLESVCCDDRRSQDSGGNNISKRRATKDRRGCYKRKKTAESWTVVSPTTEDGHAWRKYGQKEILNSKNPRSYFRCTHKYDQGCQATKQVQRIEDNPQMYETLYIGAHTCCRDNLQMLTDSDDVSWESCMGSTSNPKNIPKLQEDHIIMVPSTVTLSVKQESNKEFDHVTNKVCSLESITGWKESVPFESLLGGDEGAIGIDYEAVASAICSSCTEATSQSLDMDIVQSVDIDRYFQFDDDLQLF